MRSVSPIAMCETSRSMCSGTSSGSASTWISRSGCESTPPSCTPGASLAADQVHGHGRGDRPVEPDLVQVDVRDAAAHLVQLVVLEDRGVRLARAVDLDVEDRVQAARRRSARGAARAPRSQIATGSPRAVEDAGDDAPGAAGGASRATRGARAVLTISFVRSPAIPAAECSGDPAPSLQTPGVFEELLRGWDGEEAVIRYDERERRVDLRLRPLDRARPGGRRHADARLRRSRRTASPTRCGSRRR